MDHDKHNQTVKNSNSNNKKNKSNKSLSNGNQNTLLLSAEGGSNTDARSSNIIVVDTIPQRGLHDGYEQAVRTKTHQQQKQNQKQYRQYHQMSDTRSSDAKPSVGAGKKAFEQNFILSTLKGVANALRSSHRNSLKQSLGSSSPGRRPTSAISTLGTPPASSSSSSSCSTPNSHGIHHHHRHSTPASGIDMELASNCSTSSSVSSNLGSSNMIGPIDCYENNNNSSSGGSNNNNNNSRNNDDNINTSGTTTNKHNNISGSNNSNNNYGSRSSISNNNFNVTISSDHLSLLESMKFDQTSDIESIKKDLIKICRENRLEILAHYVSQIG